MVVLWAAIKNAHWNESVFNDANSRVLALLLDGSFLLGCLHKMCAGSWSESVEHQGQF